MILDKQRSSKKKNLQLQTFHVSHLIKSAAGSAASTTLVLKHSCRMITCTAAITLVSLSFCACVKADPPRGTSGWIKSFEDTFTKGFDPKKWNKTFWWGDGNINDGAVSYYSPNNVSVSNGYLSLKANNNSEAGKSYTGGTVNTYGKFYQTYGYFEARVKVPKGGGLGPDFALSAEDKSWPPEINISEVPGARGVNATTVWMTNHYKDGAGNPSFANAEGSWTASSGLDTDYHTYGLLWQAGLLVWYVDGFERYRTKVGVPNKPCYIVFMSGVSNDNGRWTGNPTNTTFPKYMSVDWVRAWKK